jgi:uncharacterized protein YaeQ
MASAGTLFHISVDLSKIDEGVYERLELRLAQHPSEDQERVVTRALAYCLVYDEDLRWGRGLDDADGPALFVNDATEQLLHWIDVGTPSAERMHRASKAAPHLTVVCHKGPEALIRERAKRRIHNAAEIDVWLIDPALVKALADRLDRSVDWAVVLTGEELMVSVGSDTFTGLARRTTLTEL